MAARVMAEWMEGKIDDFDLNQRGDGWVDADSLCCLLMDGSLPALYWGADYNLQQRSSIIILVVWGSSSFTFIFFPWCQDRHSIRHRRLMAFSSLKNCSSRKLILRLLRFTQHRARDVGFINFFRCLSSPHYTTIPFQYAAGRILHDRFQKAEYFLPGAHPSALVLPSTMTGWMDCQIKEFLELPPYKKINSTACLVFNGDPLRSCPITRHRWSKMAGSSGLPYVIKTALSYRIIR